MKKIGFSLMFFLFSIASVFGDIQKDTIGYYGMKLSVNFESTYHNIEYDTEYTITFYDKDGNRIGTHKEYLGSDWNKSWTTRPLFIYANNKYVAKININGEHIDRGNTGSKKTRGTIDKDFFFDTSDYPCSEKTYREKFVRGSGAQGDTYLNLSTSIHPFSYTWIGDVKLKKGGTLPSSVTIEYENGGASTEYLADYQTDERLFFSYQLKNYGIKKISTRIQRFQDVEIITYTPTEILYTDTLITFSNGSTIDLKFNRNNIWQADENGLFSDEEETELRSGEFHNNMSWQYSIDSTKTWKPIPGVTSGNVFLTTKTVFGNNYKDHVGQNVHFKALYNSCVKATETTTLSLQATISAPHIDSVTYQLPTCHKGDDAKLLIHFDRELYPTEKLYVSTEGIRFTEKKLLEHGTKVLEIPGLYADTLDIGLLGNYKFGNDLKDTIFTYTEGERHKYSIRIPDRPALSLDLIGQASVHCYGGHDGKVFVRAGGGTGVFDAFLYKGGTRQDSIRFSASETAEFKELNEGAYQVSIQDTNGCVWDASGNPVVGTITVTEPADNVIILDHKWEEPKGFGLSDGWAQVTFRGGTSSSYHVVWKDSLNNVIPNTITPDGSTFISKVENIKSSTYFVTVQDANYPLVNPVTEENTCGCTDTISFFVEEPPKLEVYVEELHYVTCNGDKDGSIVAHAKGGRPHSTGLPYTYEWVKVEGATTVPVSQSDSIITELYSGYYRVKITDSNNISVYSSDYYLVQPDPLAVTTHVLQNITCSGDSIGIIEATATGGTPPYAYIWSTNDTTKIVSGLPQGNYVVGVRDARYRENILGHYCFAQTYDSIMAPNSIRLNATVKNPVCSGYANGEIKLNVTGGFPPYSYQWEDGTTQTTRSNLPEGDYYVKVTDTNGCFMEEYFTLVQPEPVIVELGDDFVLCKNQTIAITGTVNYPNVSYTWTNTAGDVLSTVSSLGVSQGGTYTLTATTPDGCLGSDEIFVEESDDEVIPDFVIASKVANNIKVYAVNLTRTESDSIKWIIPEDVSILEEQEDRIGLLFPENGNYIVGMVVHKNKCRDILHRNVSVVNKEDIEDDVSQEPFLKRFIVSPNPNNGEFRVTVELREPADYALYLFDISGKLIETKEIKNKMSEITQFNNMSITSGAYYLRFVSAQTASVFNIIVE